MIDNYKLLRIDRETWDLHWPKIRQAPILQSWEYGEAKRQAQGCRVQRFLLQNDKGEPVGLMQALVYALPLIGGVARINRGPVFFSDALRVSPSREDVMGIMAALRKTAQRERWRLLRIIPEFQSENGDLAAALVESGFKKRQTLPVASAAIDLTRAPEEIRAGFDGKWRNLLNKSEKMGLELEAPTLDEALPFLIGRYEAMQQEKGFKGLPTKLIRAMVMQNGPTSNCSILYARHEGERHGAVMTVGHGDACTYLIGWTSDAGRSLQANYFLLWLAMLMQRDRGCKYFDVGGLGANTTAGVEHFKKRLKGQEYSLIGEYSYASLPFLR